MDALNDAVTIAHEHGTALIEAESLRARAETRARLRDLDRARSDAEDALAIFARLGAHRECATVEALAKEFRSN
jgi:hypothetical protein